MGRCGNCGTENEADAFRCKNDKCAEIISYPREELPKLKSKNGEELEDAGEFLKLIFIFSIIFYFGPALLSFLWHFLQLVVKGDHNFHEVDWNYYSFQQVDASYREIGDWFGNLFSKFRKPH